MPSLSERVRQARQGRELVILPAHTRWNEDHKGNLTVSQDAIQFAVDVWTQKFKHPRDQRYSPSGLSYCPRRSLLAFAGEPEAPRTVEDADLMMQGTVAHLYWQMEGISAGYLTNCEGWATDGHRLSGSVDGICTADGGIFEYKNMRSMMFSRYVTSQNEPNPAHVLQMHAYFRLHDTDRGSLLYQQRDGGQTHEFRVFADAAIERELDRLLETLDGHVDAATLPEAYEDCLTRTSYRYRQCPQRHNCLAHHRGERA